MICDDEWGAGGLPLQKIPQNAAKKGGVASLPLQKRLRTMIKEAPRKWGAGGLPLQKRIKLAKRGCKGVSPAKENKNSQNGGAEGLPLFDVHFRRCQNSIFYGKFLSLI